MARHIHTQVQIEAPAAHVWSVLMDWDRYGDWNPWMLDLRGEAVVGARLDVTVKLGTKTMRFRPTLIELVPGRSFRWMGHTLVRGIFDGAHGFAVESTGESSARLVHEEEFGGVAAGLLLRFIREKTERGFRQMNEALKRQCETATGSVRSTA